MFFEKSVPYFTTQLCLKRVHGIPNTPLQILLKNKSTVTRYWVIIVCMSLVINSTTSIIFESLLTNLINRWTNIEKRREIIRPHRPAKTNTKAVEMLRSIIDSLILLFDNTSLRRETNGDKVSSYHKGTTIIYCARGGGGGGAGGVGGWISIPDTPPFPLKTKCSRQNSFPPPSDKYGQGQVRDDRWNIYKRI